MNANSITDYQQMKRGNKSASATTHRSSCALFHACI